jgi:hypothetical protein
MLCHTVCKQDLECNRHRLVPCRMYAEKSKPHHGTTFRVVPGVDVRIRLSPTITKGTFKKKKKTPPPIMLEYTQELHHLLHQLVSRNCPIQRRSNGRGGEAVALRNRPRGTRASSSLTLRFLALNVPDGARGGVSAF